MPQSKILLFAFCALAVLLGSCASLQPDFDEPVVEVIGIQPSNNSAALEFAIQLRVTNPNRSDIVVNGIYYQLSVEGTQLVSGTATDIPVIAAYDSTELILPAKPNLFGSITLLAKLANQPSSSIRYRLDMKVDIKNHLAAYRIKREGSIDLSGRQQSI